MVKSVDVTVCHHTIHWLIVVIAVCWLIFENHLAKFVEYAKLKKVFFKKVGEYSKFEEFIKQKTD